MSPRASRLALAVSGALIALLVAGCGTPPGPPRWMEPPAHTFAASVTVVPDDDGRLRPQVQASVPYQALVFHHDSSLRSRYTSRLEVVVTAWRGDQPAGGGVGVGQAWSPTPIPDQPGDELVVAVPLQIRGLEPVTLSIEARVVGTGRTWKRSLTLEPRTLAAAPVLLSELRLDLPEGHELPAEQVMLPLSASVVRLPGAAPWPAAGVVLDLGGHAATGEALPRRREPIQVAPAVGDTLRITVDWPVAELPFGQLTLDGALAWRAGQDDLRLPWDRPLELVNLTVPVTQDRVWRNHLEWLDGLWPEARLDSLRAVPAVGRRQAWRELWREVGDQARCDHLRRIVAADRRFGGRQRGAGTDRGRVLIRWGEPDAVEQQLDQRNLGGVWEVWTYEAQNQRFFFHDPYGLGDFQLRRTDTAR